MTEQEEIQLLEKHLQEHLAKGEPSSYRTERSTITKEGVTRRIIKKIPVNPNVLSPIKR